MIVAVFAAGFVLTGPAPMAHAGDGGSWVTCGQEPKAGCDMGVEGQDHISADPRVKPAGRSRGSRQCKDWLTSGPAECYLPEFGWMGEDGCYYKQIPRLPPADRAAWGGEGKGPGAWHSVTCFGVPGTGGGLVWRPTAPGGGAPPPPPIVLARQALARLNLPSPVISANPAVQRAQLVRVPTWLWIDRSSWGARSESASVPGISVTTTATPMKVSFSMGDGSTVTCRGPGTPYAAGADPTMASPTCGHTFTRSSAGQPNDAFSVSATITWTIGWAGGGESGSFPPLTTAATAVMRVAESQAIVTSARR